MLDRGIAVKVAWPWEAVVIGLLALVLCTHQLGVQGFWHDELLALVYSTGSSEHLTIPPDVLVVHPPRWTHLDGSTHWWAAWTALAADAHPPMHFLLLRLCREFFGEGELAARSLSCAASVTSVILLYATTRILEGRVVAGWSSLLLAVSTTQIELAQETRNYALLLMFSMGAALAVARISRDGISRGRLIGLTACLLAMMLTHYFAIAAIAAIGLYAMGCLPKRSGRAVWLCIGIAMILFLAIWGPMLWRQWTHFGEPESWLDESPTNHLTRLLSRLLTTPGRLLVGRATTMIVGGPIPDWAIWVPIPIFLWALVALRRRQSLQFWMIWFCCVVGMLAVLDAVRSTMHVRYTRYMILALPAFCVMVGAFGSGARWRQIVCGVFVILCITQLPYAYTEKPHWSVAVERIEHDGGPDEPILFATADRAEWYPSSLYLAMGQYLPGGHMHPIAILSHPPDADLTKTLATKSGVWVMTDRETPVPTTWIRNSSEQEKLDISAIEVLYHLKLTPPS